MERVILTACGTSYHAALVGEYLFEEFARLPVEVEYASEFRYRNPPIDRNTVVLAITQSGETADTLAALRESKRMGHTTLAICNVVGSSIAREADGGVYLHAGPEIGVASTKAFTSQVCVLTMLALYLGRTRHLSSIQGQRIIDDLQALPGVVRKTLACHERVRAVAAGLAARGLKRGDRVAAVARNTIDTAVAFEPRSVLVGYVQRTEDLALCGRGAPCRR